MKQIDRFVGIQTVKVVFLICGWKKDYLTNDTEAIDYPVGGETLISTLNKQNFKRMKGASIKY